ncbi:MAG: peptidase [Rhodospirillales bacterium]|nr:peptidase [Rhodospirillales bacterium]
MGRVRLTALLSALFIVLVAVPARAQDGRSLRFGFPADCGLGESCFIQNYVDHDVGPGAKDFVCGPLTYDGHKGTDIALPDRAAMARGVAVLAAAPGRVRNIRDGVADASIRDAAAPDIKGRECGNGVVIAHEGGWETQYCHMREGSIAVRPGQEIQAGDRLGLIGLSGDTEFPHLHFQLSLKGVIVDPFDGQPQATSCEAPDTNLWATAIPYGAGGVAAAGFAAESPQRAKANDGAYSASPLARAGFLSFWVEAYGVREGDVNRLSVIGPDGSATLRGALTPSARTQARQFHAIGRAAPPAGWPAGSYRGEYQLVRDGRVIAQTVREATIP